MNFLEFQSCELCSWCFFCFVLVCFSILWDILTEFILVNFKGPWHIPDNWKLTTCAFKLCECGFATIFVQAK